jgi:hypothetical protein
MNDDSINDDIMNDDFFNVEEPQPTGTDSNRKTIIIVVVAAVLLCCCLGVFLYTAYFYWGDPLLEYLGY